MSYSTSTIGALLDDVNRRYFLPAIQRPFVWSPAQVIALFDSLLKGYPISSFMFWAVKEETKAEVRIYKFIDNYHADALNEPTAPDGRDVVLVLDGQQRLTSLLIGLRGTFAEKEKHARRSNPDAWVSKTLYLDLLKDPESDGDDDDGGLGVTYGLHFHAKPPRNDHRNHWIKLGTILDCPTEEKLELLIKKVVHELHRGATSFDADLATSTLRRLHQVVWGDEAVNYYTERDQSADRVLDIFVRANDGGTKLSKSDLLMSMITSKWQSGNAREVIFDFVGFINKSLHQPNAINKDIVLKACLVLSEFDVKYNVSNFTTHAVATVEANWKAIATAIENTFRLNNRFGLSADNLTSLNAVLPIAYYLYRTPEFTFRGSSEFERHNAACIHRWLLNSLLVGAFAGNSDRTIALARAAIRESLKTDRGFPIDRLFDALATGGRISKLDDRAIEDLLEWEYGKGKTFLALSVLYDGIDWSAGPYHVDHIIPQAHAQRRILQGMNIPEHRIREIESSVNKLGNLQLLTGEENIEKGELPFDAWMTSRSRHYSERNLIPDRLDFQKAALLPEFVREREKLIRKRLLHVSGKMPTEAWS